MKYYSRNQPTIWENLSIKKNNNYNEPKYIKYVIISSQ